MTDYGSGLGLLRSDLRFAAALRYRQVPLKLLWTAKVSLIAAMVSEAVGYDAGKKVKGRKRFVTVDTLGLVLRVLITAASVGEREGGKQVLKKVKQMEPSVSRLHTIWVDAGFDGNPFMHWVMDFCRWIIQVVIRPKESKKFVLLPKRWVVERTLGWLTW
jgi:transposase